MFGISIISICFGTIIPLPSLSVANMFVCVLDMLTFDTVDNNWLDFGSRLGSRLGPKLGYMIGITLCDMLCGMLGDRLGNRLSDILD